MMPTRTLALFALCLAACAYDELELAEEQAAIEDGTPANSFQWGRAVDFNGMNCTGTKVGPRHVLTAVHCNPRANMISAKFYSTWQESNDSPAIKVVDVFMPPGTSGDPTDYIDSSGRHADVAVLELESSVAGPYAVMHWDYPGSDYLGAKVGGGNHEGIGNETGELRQRSDYTYGDDDDGMFMTNQAGVNKQDSGGPFYLNGRVLGTLTGTTWDIVWRGKHTSVPEHLDFILTSMNWRWSHRPDSDTYRSGSAFSVQFGRTSRVCQYICWNTTSCVAFNHFSGAGTCMLLSSVTGETPMSGVLSAEK